MVTQDTVGDLAAMSPHLEFELLPELDLSELKLIWEELESRSSPTFFLSWNWIGCWLAEAEIAPQLVIGRALGRVILLGVLVHKRRWTRIGFPINSLHLHNTGESAKDVITIEYNAFLVDKEWAGRVEREAIEFLLAPRQRRLIGYNEIHLRNVSDAYVENAPASGCLNTVLWRRPSWRVDLDAVRTSGKPYLDHLSANTRQQIRRSLRLYEREGPLTTVRATDIPTALHYLDGLKAFHQHYWIGRGEQGGFSHEFFERFLRRLIETCHVLGTIEVLRISRGEQPIGYLYNLIYRGHVFAYQSGFLYENNPKLKPGLVAHSLCIEHHVKAGARIYDFMAGDYRYKADLGRPGPFMSFLLLQHPAPSVLCERLARRGYRFVRGMWRS